MNSSAPNQRPWRPGTDGSASSVVDYASAVAGLAGLLIYALGSLSPDWAAMAQMPNAGTHSSKQSDDRATDGVETLVAGYVGNPIYYRSNFSVVRPDGTDLKLHGLG